MSAKIIKILKVKQPWASLIIAGIKTWEMRSRHTQVRGRIGIMSTWSPPDYDALQSHQTYLKSMGYTPIPDEFFQDLPQGVILGTVEVTDSVLMWDSDWDGYRPYHCTPFEMIMNIGWKLERPVAFDNPIKHKSKPGAIIWENLKKPLIEDDIKMVLPDRI